MSWGWSSARGRLLSRAGIGVLSWVIPPGLVDEAVGDGLAWEMRLRALPARLGVYFVLGCALLSAEPYGEVIRRVVAGLERALAAAGWLVTVLACGTRALLDAAIAGVRGKGTGEQVLARQLLRSLRPGMLLLADRNFYGYQLWNAAAATGADLLWRVKASLHLPVVRELPDGSFLAHVSDPRAVLARTRRNGDRRRRGSRPGPETGPLPGITVRVIEFWLTIAGEDGAVRTERYRLITTLLDHRRYPAADLAACHAWRWAIETGYRECKTYLRGPGRVLRGRTPDLARQELWAHLAVHQAIPAIIVRAAAGAGIDPDQVSFTAALHAIQRTMDAGRDQAAALDAAETEILACLLPQRQGRICSRAVNKPSSPYPSKHNHHGPISQHAS